MKVNTMYTGFMGNSYGGAEEDNDMYAVTLKRDRAINLSVMRTLTVKNNDCKIAWQNNRIIVFLAICKEKRFLCGIR